MVGDLPDGPLHSPSASWPLGSWQAAITGKHTLFGALRIQYRLFLANCSDLVKNLKDSVDNHPYFSSTDGSAIIRCWFLGESTIPKRRHLATTGGCLYFLNLGLNLFTLTLKS
jgi:hypothetical protein